MKKDRTKCVLLSDVQAVHCTTNNDEVCRIHSPIYITNSRGSCEMALFRQKRADIERYCKVRVGSNSRYPIAVPVGKGVWVIATHENMKFSVRCTGGDRNTLSAHAPLSTVRIGDGCTAYGDSIILPQQLRGRSIYEDLDVIELTPINVTDSVVWSQITRKFPNFSASSIPAALRDIEEIPVQDVLNKLEALSQTRPLIDRQTLPTHIIPIIGALVTVVLFVVLVGLGWWCKSRANKQQVKGDYLRVPIGYGIAGERAEAQATNIPNVALVRKVVADPIQSKRDGNDVKDRPLRLFRERV